MCTKVSPSLLAADFLDLREDINMINQSDADWLHLDIMDGIFVPNISFGFPVIDQKFTSILYSAGASSRETSDTLFHDAVPLYSFQSP